MNHLWISCFLGMMDYLLHSYWKFTSSKRVLLLTFILTSAMDSPFVIHDKIAKHVPAYVICHTRLLFRRWWPRLLLLHPTAHEPFDNHGGQRVRRLWHLLHGIRAACLRIVGRGRVNKYWYHFHFAKIFKISLNEKWTFLRYRFKHAIDDSASKNSEEKIKETCKKIRSSIQGHERAIRFPFLFLFLFYFYVQSVTEIFVLCIMDWEFNLFSFFTNFFIYWN